MNIWKKGGCALQDVCSTCNSNRTFNHTYKRLGNVNLVETMIIEDSGKVKFHMVFGQLENKDIVREIIEYRELGNSILDKETNDRQKYWKTHTISLDQINKFVESKN